MNLSYTSAAFVVLAALLLFFLLGWILARRVGKWAVVDVFWTFSLALGALLFAAVAENPDQTSRRWIVAACVTLWSLRLGIHILRRVRREQGDDPRYGELAERWQEKASVRMLMVFEIQALLSFLLLISVFVAMSAPAGLWQTADIAAIAIATLAIAGESIADRQLTAYKRDPSPSKPRVCKTGLWRYSRHPNYFFEWAYWLCFIPFGLSSGAWWATLISPLLMFVVITRVTGIPPAEKQSLKSRGDAYRQYQRETSAFFPWFPKPIS